jgi:hypothetical protein
MPAIVTAGKKSLVDCDSNARISNVVCAAGALVDSDSGEEDEDGFSEAPMIAGLGSLGCANGSLCVSASFVSREVGVVFATRADELCCVQHICV